MLCHVLRRHQEKLAHEREAARKAKARLDTEIAEKEKTFRYVRREVLIYHG
jgi:hypothetical protein